MSLRTILLDIEGTTTPVDFVYETLFPYAGNHVTQYLENNRATPEVLELLEELSREHNKDKENHLTPPEIADPRSDEYLDSVIRYINWLMDKDRKSTPLKALQGRIWDEGYARGELRSIVFPDVTEAMSRWYAAGRRIYIFSSGSVHAQKLLFRHTTAGDLTPFISGYFDTNIGSKKDAESYQRIAGEIGVEPSEIIFISDVTEELVAAGEAGMATLLSMRPGNKSQPDAGRFTSITSFDEVSF